MEFPIEITVTGPVGTGKTLSCELISYALSIAGINHVWDSATNSIHVENLSDKIIDKTLDESLGLARKLRAHARQKE